MILLPEKPMHAQAISHLSPQTLDMPVATDPKDLPIWNYDGSSTNQAPGHDSRAADSWRRVR